MRAIRHAEAGDALAFSRRHTWHDDAACQGADTVTFFPDVYGSVTPRQVAPAAALCACCPVIQHCAQAGSEPSRSHRRGIWGGFLWREAGRSTVDILHLAGWIAEPRTPP